MAQIDFRGWRIQSDTECWALGKLTTRENKRLKTQEEYLLYPTYHSTLDLALSALIQRELRASNAVGMQEVQATLRQIKQELADIFGANV